MIGFLASIFAFSFALTALGVPLVIRVARRTGFMDIPGPRKVHARPVPYGGGLAVAAGLLLTLALGMIAARLHIDAGWFSWAPGIVKASAGPAWARFSTVGLFALGSLVILLLGLADDRWKLSARHKLGVEAIIAIAVVVNGERLEFFTGDRALGSAVTVLWILGVTNAFNLLDHMDGLSSGVASLAMVAFIVVAVQTGQYLIASTLAALLGACTAFLAFNFPPAKIFLGDAGSLFIGFWLACLTVSFTFYEAQYPLYTYLVPLAVLAVPLFDTASVVLIRLRSRRPIFEGDRNHLAHRLTALGMSPRRAVLTIYGLTLTGGVSAVLLYHVSQAGALLVLSQLLLTFAIMTLLEVAGRGRDGGGPAP